MQSPYITCSRIDTAMIFIFSYHFLIDIVIRFVVSIYRTFEHLAINKTAKSLNFFDIKKKTNLISRMNVDDSAASRI